MKTKDIQQFIRDRLAELTDITGFEHDNKEHHKAFNLAVDSIQQLVEDEKEAGFEFGYSEAESQLAEKKYFCRNCKTYLGLEDKKFCSSNCAIKNI